MATKTKTRRNLTLRDRLSRLNYKQALKLLGSNGDKLIRQGGAYDNIDLDRDVYLRGDLFRLTLPRAADDGSNVNVTMTLIADRRNRLNWNCDRCGTTCEHVGAAFSLILDDKYSLGLSDIPKEGVPLERLSESDLLLRAIAEREQRATKERFRLQSADPKRPWTDYVITSGHSGKSYRVALRGLQRGQSYCSCPDFAVNTLGTCKHILYALSRVRSKFSNSQLARPFKPKRFAVHLLYGDEISLRLQVPARIDKDVQKIIDPLVDRDLTVPQVLDCIKQLQARGHSVTVYPDAEQSIQQHLHEQCVAEMVADIRRAPARHELRRSLLKSELLPYQLDGIAFAVGAGRAILADDMGLGKTIQGIGVAELLARVADIRRVLVICPATLKSQWRGEIGRFCDRDCQVVLGTAEERSDQYDNGSFFTICNYEQVLRDIELIDRVPWDLIILDEGQRIKNWESKTSDMVKRLRSPFALVLSGTPLENRLDELYSVVQFIDGRRLGPGFRFFHRHRVVDEQGKTVGYKNLKQLRETLRPVLLRRTRQSVLQQLPERNTEIIRIPASAEQASISNEQVAKAARIAAKKFLTEMDLLAIQKALLMARLAADSTFLVDKNPPGVSTKLEHLDGLLDRLFGDSQRKAVLFSEWTTMLDLIEPLLRKRGIGFVRLDGSVPQKKRQQLVHRFRDDAECRLFLSTNAGSTGLNLQAADTVINVDLPWNPAVLEQRIARAHRMGQKRPVDVFLLVTENTFEERLLGTLADKQDLSLAVLDPDAQVDGVGFRSGMQNLKQRLEVLLGNQPPAPQHHGSQQKAQADVDKYAERRERVAAAGGEMISAMVNFLGEIVTHEDAPQPDGKMVDAVRKQIYACGEPDAHGRRQLTFILPDDDALDQFAKTVASIITASSNSSKTPRRRRKTAGAT